MTNILTNSAALLSQFHLKNVDDAGTQATERLASGKRINNAGDDAAGAAIVNRMTSQISGMEVAIRNAGDAISMAQTAEGALGEVSEILQRMRELGVQAANGTYSGADRVSLNAEIVQLKKELTRIGEATTFNNTKLLNGTFQDTEFELGFDESPNHSHTLSIDDVRPTKLGVWNMSSQLEKKATVSSVVSTKIGTGAVKGQITTSASHGFVAGDQITYEIGSGTAMAGLIPNRTYKVIEPVAEKSFVITELDGTTASDSSDSGSDVDNTIVYGNMGGHTGVGTTFSLASLAGAPTLGESGDAAPASATKLNESLKIYGYVGTETITYPEGSNARQIAEAVTAKSGTTGVTAYAETNAQITLTPNNSTDGSGSTIISFTLKGMNATAKTISATVKFGTGETPAANQPDLSDLRDKINGLSGDTGISATLSSDRTNIHLKSPDGYDIVIDDFDMPANTETSQTQATVPAGNIADGSGHTIFTAGAAHGFETGDMVRASELSFASGTPSASGISPAKLYFVTKLSDTTFKLNTGSQAGLSVDLTEASGDDSITAVVFTKEQKTMNFQTMDRDGNLKGAAVKLFDQNLGNNEKPNTTSSLRMSGQITYESPNVFTITSGASVASDKVLFRDAPPSASLLKISDIDVLTVKNSQRMLSAVDGALRRIDAEKGDLGATMNRMEHTIDNLSNIVMNTKVARGRKEDADMATESIELSKSRILQQAATSMLSQANKTMQSVLELLS
jgi:flagellin